MSHEEDSRGPSSSIELNYSISRVKQGSFSQSDERFLPTAGIQCACISLYSICYSTVKQVARWSPNDIDFNVTQGDRLFKHLNYDRPLSSDELPRHIHDSHFSFSVQYTKNLYGLLKVGCLRSETTLLQIFLNFNSVEEKGIIFLRWILSGNNTFQ